MTTYSDMELESLLRDLESDLVERKESLKGDAPKKARQAVCAFDAKPIAGAKLSDISLRRFEEEYLPQAFHPEVLSANDRSIEERLAATKMIASSPEPTPTVAGMLVLGIRPRDFLPGAYVQFLRIAGDAFGDPIVDELEIDGVLSDVVRRLDEKLASHNRTSIDFVSASREIRTSTYPLPAVQQLTRNAVLHRTYEFTNAPVRVYWFNDRIEVISPGGPYGALTVETFGQPGISDYRNPVLAEAMRVLGLVQRFGFGIPTARKQLEQSGHPPLELELNQNWVRCCVRAKS